MPFLEVVTFDRDIAARRRMAEAITQGLCASLDVSKDIVTIYFQTVDPEDYSHAGELATNGRRRIFVKVHAFARPLPYRRRAARTVCDAITASTDCDPRDIAIYFFDRQPHEVAHSGTLEVDLQPLCRSA